MYIYIYVYIYINIYKIDVKKRLKDFLPFYDIFTMNFS